MSKPKTTSVGTGDKKADVARIGHGLMMMTWKKNPVPDEECFESIKASLDSVPTGTKMLINSGEFYGINPREANLELLARFFEKYPSYADKAFLSVKGGVNFEKLAPDGSPECLRRSVDNILAKLRGTKRLDLFECARVPTNVSVEEQIKTLSELVAEGKFDHIGMSECNATTLRRANAVHPIAMVEIEVSPWSYDDKIKEVVATTGELGIVVAAYSPLGRGFLVGRYTSVAELDEGDMRAHMDRLNDENINHNKAIADGLRAIAQKKQCSPAQLCLAWVCSLGNHVVPIPGSSHASRTLENLSAADVDLTADDAKAIEKVLEDHPVKGGRYNAALESSLMR